jgi:hypothetical protein
MFSYKKLINVLARKEKHIANDDRLIFECLFDFLSGKSEIGIAQTMFGHGRGTGQGLVTICFYPSTTGPCHYPRKYTINV